MLASGTIIGCHFPACRYC